MKENETQDFFRTHHFLLTCSPYLHAPSCTVFIPINAVRSASGSN